MTQSYIIPQCLVGFYYVRLKWGVVRLFRKLGCYMQVEE